MTYDFIKKYLLRNSPLSLIYFVTSRCNCRCKHCFFYSDLNKDLPKELNLAEIKKIAGSLGSLLYLNVTGGEPFLRKDLYQIVELFYKNCGPIKITINTNGFYTTEIVNFCKKLKNLSRTMFELNISIDGLYGQHDLIRGVKGIFEEAIDTYKELKQIKKEISNLRVGFIATAMKENMDTLKSTMDFLKKLEPDFVSLNLIRGEVKDPSQKEIKYGDFEAYLSYSLNRKRESILQMLRGVKTEYLIQLRKKIYLENKYQIKCLAGQSIGVLYPEGEVKPCEILESSMGNIKDYHYNFKDLWKSREAVQIRKMITKSKCFCTHECFLTASIVFSPYQLIKVLSKCLKLVL